MASDLCIDTAGTKESAKHVFYNWHVHPQSHHTIQYKLHIVFLKQGNQHTTYSNIHAEVIDVACKSQIKSHHIPGHQLLLNCEVFRSPQDRRRWKHHLLSLLMSNSKTHTANMPRVLASIPRPLTLEDPQSNQVSQFYRSVSTQEAGKKKCFPRLKHPNAC